MSKKILPYRWYTPYPYQKEVFAAVDSGIKKIFLMWHRRSGKDLTSFCLIVREAIKRVGEYYYLLPSFTQAIKIIWSGADNTGRKVVDYINPDIVESISQTNKTIKLINGSMIRLVGAHTNSDSLRGTNPVGVVFSEAAFMSKEVWTTIQPILTANKGLMIFQSTPNSRNDFYDVYQKNKGKKNWFVSVKTVDDTVNNEGERLITEQDIEDEKDTGVTEGNIESEWYCKFTQIRRGSYYGPLVQQARDEHRIGAFAYDENLDVDLYYDLGVDDSTCIWFVQLNENKKIFIDYLEANGEGLEYYADELKRRGYKYGVHYLPHDGNKRSIQTGVGTADVYKDICYKAGISDYIVVGPRASLQFGINCVRENFRQYHFNEYNCEEGIKKIENYKRKWDAVNKEYKSAPYHDKNSHAADALRLEAIMNQGGARGHDTNVKFSKLGDFDSYNIWENYDGI